MERQEEKELMEKIRMKMDRIRANQRKTLGSQLYKPKHHYQGTRTMRLFQTFYYN